MDMLYALPNEKSVNVWLALAQVRGGKKSTRFVSIVLFYQTKQRALFKLSTITLVKNTGLGPKNLDWLIWCEF